MLKSCEICGKEFTARRSTAKYCSNACRHRAQRAFDIGKINAEPPEVRLALTADEIAGVIQQAHRATDDMSRASEHAPGVIGGKLRRCSEAFADALGAEGL